MLKSRDQSEAKVPAGMSARVWRPRHPLIPRAGTPRRCAVVAMTLILWGLIAAYVYYTNEGRVRVMAADYLADLLGGQVRIGGADLSLFEGLRLDDVQVLAPGATRDDSPLLEASAVYIRYSLRDLLSGRLIARQIVAVSPRVRLAQDVQSGQWNFQLLQPGRWRAPGGGAATPMPEILLRDARVDYLEAWGGQTNLSGSMTLDGRFGSAGASGKYEFSFQTRVRDTLGPTVDGEFDSRAGCVLGNLRNVAFVPQTQALLPRQVRQWCGEHRLAGRMNVALYYVLNSDFRVEAQLDGVDLAPDPRSLGRPMMLHNVRGLLIFTPRQIAAKALTAELENNRISIDGSMEGYSSDDAIHLTIASAGEFNIAENLAASLPSPAREIYQRFRPSGRGTATVRLSRLAPGGRLECQARIDVSDGGFIFADLPYPIRHVTGQVLVEHDPQLEFDVVRLVNLRGHGSDGGANAKATLIVNGWIGPFDRTAGGRLTVTGRDFHYEPAVRVALARQAARALDLLDPHRAGFGPDMTASFSALSFRSGAGKIPGKHWNVTTDVAITGARATYANFDYPLRDLWGTLRIGEGYVDVNNVQGRHGDCAVRIDGRIDTGGGSNVFLPDLNLTARNLPIDDGLRAAVSPDARRWLEKLGAAGDLDVDGRIQKGYDLNLTLNNGSLSPGGKLVAEKLVGKIHLTPRRLELTDLSGRHAGAPIAGDGWVDWTGGTQTILIQGQAKDLVLDDQVFAWLSPQGQMAWRQMQPTGTVDGTVLYENGAMRLTILPRKLSVSPRLWPGAQPCAVQDVTGRVNVIAGEVVTWNVAGRHGRGWVATTGSWRLDDPNAPLELRLRGDDMAVDDELTRALPAGLVQIMQILHLRGTTGFDFTKLSYHPAPATQPAENVQGPDVDFTAQVSCKDGALNIGVPVTELAGSAVLVGSVRSGRLRDLTGELYADNLRLAGCPAGDLRAELSKPGDESTVHVTDLRATIAGGRLAGDLAVTMNDNGPGRYAVSLVLDDADVRQLAGESDLNVRGSLSASLQMSGVAGDPAAQRGRGDVRVVGGQMYQIPLLLGLFQVVNLSLPISAPFDSAGAGYIVQGQRVVLEHIRLGSKDMTMEGSGHIDLAKKEVEMTFATDNPDWLTIPVVGPIWQNARNELLRIHVKGSLLAPKVSATSLDTFTTTVDRVFNGDR